MRFFLIILFILICNSVTSQERIVSGRVLDVVGEGLPGVSILDSISNRIGITDCYGAFSINRDPDQIIKFSKENYKTVVISLDSSLKKPTIMKMDSLVLIKKLRSHLGELFDGQPLFIVDGEIFYSKDLLDHKNSFVIRGNQGREIAGDYARNGIVFIKTRCDD